MLWQTYKITNHIVWQMKPTHRFTQLQTNRLVEIVLQVYRKQHVTAQIQRLVLPNKVLIILSMYTSFFIPGRLTCSPWLPEIVKQSEFCLIWFPQVLSSFVCSMHEQTVPSESDTNGVAAYIEHFNFHSVGGLSKKRCYTARQLTIVKNRAHMSLCSMHVCIHMCMNTTLEVTLSICDLVKLPSRGRKWLC